MELLFSILSGPECLLISCCYGIIQDCCYSIQKRWVSWKEKKKWIAPPPSLWGSYLQSILLQWAAATNGSAFLNSLAVPTVHTAVVEAIFLSRYWFPMELSFEMMDLPLGWDLEEAWLCLCSRHEFWLTLSSIQRTRGKERNH